MLALNSLEKKGLNLKKKNYIEFGFLPFILHNFLRSRKFIKSLLYLEINFKISILRIKYKRGRVKMINSISHFFMNRKGVVALRSSKNLIFQGLLLSIY